jgi:hypothetical protein
MKRALAVIVFVCMTGAIPTLASADENETQVAGTFTTQVVACTTLCTHSVYAGELAGTSDFTLISLEGTSNPDVVRYVGTLILHTAHGDLVGQDIGLWNTATGKYTDTYQVTSGTGIYVDATAVLKLKGTLDAVTGMGSSTYQGTIVFPDED